MSKRDNKLKGREGEKLACKYLTHNGYSIIHKNYTTDIGEIDIVATDGACLIFIEVKARTDETFGYPAEAVSYIKRNKINQVASQYIKQFRHFNVAVRFDIIEIYLNENRINHIENAFDSYLRY